MLIVCRNLLFRFQLFKSHLIYDYALLKNLDLRSAQKSVSLQMPMYSMRLISLLSCTEKLMERKWKCVASSATRNVASRIAQSSKKLACLKIQLKLFFF